MNDNSSDALKAEVERLERAAADLTKRGETHVDVAFVAERIRRMREALEQAGGS